MGLIAVILLVVVGAFLYYAFFRDEVMKSNRRWKKISRVHNPRKENDAEGGR